MIPHAFNLRTEVGGVGTEADLCELPASLVYVVPGQLVLHRGTLSKKKKKDNRLLNIGYGTSF